MRPRQAPRSPPRGLRSHFGSRVPLLALADCNPQNLTSPRYFSILCSAMGPKTMIRMLFAPGSAFVMVLGWTARVDSALAGSHQHDASLAQPAAPGDAGAAACPSDPAPSSHRRQAVSDASLLQVFAAESEETYGDQYVFVPMGDMTCPAGSYAMTADECRNAFSGAGDYIDGNHYEFDSHGYNACPYTWWPTGCWTWLSRYDGLYNVYYSNCPGRALSTPATVTTVNPHLGICKVSTPASATGDPHLQNLHGERFDLTKPGKFVLIHIPRGQPVENALLVVKADAKQLGGQCTDMYFVELNVTGAWADAAQAGGLHFDVDGTPRGEASWTKLGPVELKVARGRTAEGTGYLNFYVKHLGRAGFPVGGLLGEDDHEYVRTPPAGCLKHVSLSRSGPRDHRSDNGASTATSSWA